MKSIRFTYSVRLKSLLTLVAIAFLAMSGELIAQAGGWCPEPSPPPRNPNPGPPPPLCGDPKCKTCTTSPCFVATGLYSTSFTDLQVSGIGAPVVVLREYESTHQIDGPVGVGWTSSLTARIYYTTYLFQAPSTYRTESDITMPSGARYRFVENLDGTTYVPPAGRKDVLVKNGDGSWDLTLEKSKSRYHFASDGTLRTVTDDYGNVTNLVYDVNGLLQTATDAASGRYASVTWVNGRISSVADSSSPPRVVQYGYDPSTGKLTTVTDPAGRVTSYTYQSGRFGLLLKQISDNWNRVISTITFDASDRVTSYTEGGETYTYNYLSATQTTKTDSSGNVWTYTYGTTGLIGTKTPPVETGSAASSATYTADGYIDTATDEVGVKTKYEYGASGLVTAVIRDYLGTTATRFEYAYDPDPTASNKVISITPKNPTTLVVDPNWQATRYDYYHAGDPAPGALHHVYRVENNGTTLDTIATYVYDAKGRISSVLSATGGQTDYTYDPVTGDLLTVTGPSNNDLGTRPVTTYGNYDGAGRPRTITDALGNATTYTYDNLGRPLTVTLPKPNGPGDPSFVTTYSYDVLDGAYPGLTLTEITDPNGKVTKLGYDEFGQLIKATDAAGNTTTYAFAHGLLQSITDANNNVTSYIYDKLRRLKQTTFPDGKTELYTYKADGLLATKTDRKSQTITYGYDAFKRLKTKTYPGSTLITYTYTGQKLTSVVDTSITPNETHSFGYDTSYRVNSNTQATRGTLTYTYTPADRVATLTISGGGPTSTNTYYPDGSLNTITWSPVSGQVKYAYNLLGQYQTVTLPNGQTRGYSYDNQGRLLQLANALGATNLATYGYAYDVDNATGLTTMLGQRTQLTANVPTQGFANAISKYYYDSLYQLTKVNYPAAAPFASEVDQWTYDAIGNRLTNTVNGTTANYTYLKNGANPLNGQRLSNDGVNAYTWDFNGSDLTRNGVPGNFTLGYSVDNRMTSISGAATATYVYDYQGRRTSKTVSGVATTYLYDGLNLVTETTGGNPVRYLFGPGIDEPLATSQGVNVGYFSVDGLGTTGVISSPTGTAQNSYVFDAWGTARASSATLTNSFGYTSREFGEAGLLGYRARYLQPGVGRFSQEDPDLSALQAGRNVYVYVLGHPIQFVDPTGRKIHVCCRPQPLLAKFNIDLRHCFIRVSDDSGNNPTTYELMSTGGTAEALTMGIGITQKNHPNDLPWGPANTDCAESKDCPKTRSCIEAAHAMYPNGKVYDPYFGPNSNTYASFVAVACELDAPGVAKPGVLPFTKTPGWAQQPPY